MKKKLILKDKLLDLLLGFGLSVIIILEIIYMTKDIRINKEYRLHPILTNANQKINHIESWMTFSYINKDFNLPTEYLAKTLNIKNSSYPDISLKRYARENKINLTSFIMSIVSAIKNYH